VRAERSGIDLDSQILYGGGRLGPSHSSIALSNEVLRELSLLPLRIVLYAAIVGFLVTRPQLRRVWSQLDTKRRRFLGGLFVLLVAGQVVGLKYETYPFVKWGMYDGAGSTVKYVEYAGVRADGSEAPFPVAHLIRTHSTSRAIECPTCGKRLLWRLRGMVKDREKLDPGKRLDEVVRLHDRTLRAAWKVYHQRHPELDFQSVRLYRVRTTVSDFRAGRPMERQFLFEVDLTSERSAS